MYLQDVHEGLIQHEANRVADGDLDDVQVGARHERRHALLSTQRRERSGHREADELTHHLATTDDFKGEARGRGEHASPRGDRGRRRGRQRDALRLGGAGCGPCSTHPLPQRLVAQKVIRGQLDGVERQNAGEGGHKATVQRQEALRVCEGDEACSHVVDVAARSGARAHDL